MLFFCVHQNNIIWASFFKIIVFYTFLLNFSSTYGFYKTLVKWCCGMIFFSLMAIFSLLWAFSFDVVTIFKMNNFS